MGTHCEVGISPCASNPCLYGGTCVPRAGDFYCQCRGQYSGQRYGGALGTRAATREALFQCACGSVTVVFCHRCQLGPYCRDNPCKNSGKCIDSLDGPVCECEPGFQGDR